MEILLVCMSFVLLTCATFLFIQVAAALAAQDDNSAVRAGPRPTVAVLIPAHDEAAVIGTTLDLIRTQLREGDRLLVVADNCSDATASIAAATGATVVERRDEQRIGKAYALEAGLRRLEEVGPTEVIVFVDADCSLESGALDRLVVAAMAKNGPVQGSNTVVAPAEASTLHRFAAFAVRIRNHVRPLGSRVLGLQIMITGTGWAAPWHVAAEYVRGSECIVEDFELSLRFALAGIRPDFVASAQVSSWVPADAIDRVAQQQRWEQGVLKTTARHLPKLVATAFRRRNLRLLALAVEVCVPPLVTFGLTLGTAFLAAAALAVFGGSTIALILSAVALCLYLAAIGICIMRFASGTITIADLWHVWVLIPRKLSTYRGFLSGRPSKWVRTPRNTGISPIKDQPRCDGFSAEERSERI